MYRFERYRNGIRMAEGARIHHATTLEEALDKARKLFEWECGRYIGPCTDEFVLRPGETMTHDKMYGTDIAAKDAEIEQLRSSYRELEPCGHAKNFLIGDEHGHFSCTVCRIAELEAEKTPLYSDRIRNLEDKIAAKDAEIGEWHKVNDDVLALMRKALGTRDVHGIAEGANRMTAEIERLKELLSMSESARELQSTPEQSRIDRLTAALKIAREEIADLDHNPFCMSTWDEKKVEDCDCHISAMLTAIVLAENSK